MGRRAYMNLLALGRSPFEHPEETADCRTYFQSDIHGDDYTQEYDARGHPINPSSKALSKQLRRAKNDILSTMGIVVSGEDGPLGSRKDRQKSKIISDENDYGLAMATIDQVVMFVCPWWASSLGARIQVFKQYTPPSLMQIVRVERNLMGYFGFYYAGMPVWIGSFFVSVCRNHLLGTALEFIHRQVGSLFDSKRYKTMVDAFFRVVSMSTNATLVLMAGQAYMFSLLQSLHILPTSAVPRLSSLIPFGAFSITQLPPLPANISFSTISKFGFQLLMSPAVLIYSYIHLRPLIEGRIYRLLRRQLPKPDRPDKVSVRVAVENDLVEWTVPSMGRRADEENLRSRFTLVEEVAYEFILLKNWVKGFFQWKRTEKPSGDEEDDGLHILENRIEYMRQIQQEQAQLEGILGEESQSQAPRPRNPPQRTRQYPSERPSVEPTSFQHNEAFLADEGQEIMQSPQELPDGYFPPMGHSTGALESAPAPNITTGHRTFTEHIEEDTHLLNSRTNTLFSPPSSRGSSPLPSPRVRASLVHQNSNIITMQLELLQSSRTANAPVQSFDAGNDNIALLPTSFPQSQVDFDGDVVDQMPDQVIDNLRSHNRELASWNAEHATQPAPEDTAVREPLEPALEPATADEIDGTTTAVGRDSIPRSPHSMSPEPSQQPPERSTTTGSQGRMLPLPSLPQGRTLSDTILPDHRVTILSAHPVDSLASHLAALVTTVLFYPFESFFLRHLATTFLSSTAVASGAIPLGMAASTVGLRPVGAWFGGGGRTDMLAYASKMVLVTGMQALVSAGIWGAGTAVTVLLGRKKFGWGNL